MPVHVAKRAVAVVFLLNGFAYASWLSRIPTIRDRLELSASGVGLLLLCLSLGTLVALPVSGAVVERAGARNTVVGGVALVVTGLSLLAGGALVGSVPLAGIGLFAYGVGTSTWDVAMNVEAATLERRLGRAVMPRFHAGYSLGTILGAALGAAGAAGGAPIGWQLVATGALVATTVPLATRRFLRGTTADTGRDRSSGSRSFAAWRERRTLLIGLVVLAFALSEGLANDWLALTLVDAYGTTTTVGAVTLAVFVSAMTLGRTFGGGAVDRWGRVAVLRVTGGLVALGALAVAVSPHPAGAVAGAVLWGLGASLGFPLGMTAAGEEEHHAAARVSVVSSIGYTAFLGGPPLAGLLADAFGFRPALLLAVLAAGAGLVLAGAARPVGVSPAPAREPERAALAGCRSSQA
jgi:MFS family permease